MDLGGRLYHRASGSGTSYWGPGDLYTFLVTGDESGGTYFAMEAVVPAGGGPPWLSTRTSTRPFMCSMARVHFISVLKPSWPVPGIS